MESLESKLDRLTPEQRKETEDFVDFLLSRQGQPVLPDTPHDLPPVLDAAPPPLTPIEPEPGGEHRDAGPADRATPVAADAPAPAPFHEIGGGTQDRIARDYMDYGQVEHQPSPATEAVKKVRRKIIARDEQEKPRHILDWVD